MAGVRSGGARRVRAWRRVAAVFGTAAIAIAIGVFGWRAESRDEQRLATVRAEQERLQQELHEIKSIAANAEPVVYVGSTDHYDYFIDLRQLQESSAVAQPAAYRPPQPGL
jgi:histidinol-phosphate/aromatic aminotransferase/cobyric acid decarboxylase-like protein